METQEYAEKIKDEIKRDVIEDIKKELQGGVDVSIPVTFPYEQNIGSASIYEIRKDGIYVSKNKHLFKFEDFKLNVLIDILYKIKHINDNN